MKPRVLFLVHLPPPRIGPSAINQELIRSRLLREQFEPEVIPINTSARLKDIERFFPGKALVIFQRLLTLVQKIIAGRFAFAYFSLSPTGIGFFKDTLFVAVLKFFRIKILYHLHGKGLGFARSRITKVLYRFCFTRAKVILLSSCLVEDIGEYVNKNDIYILPNGIQVKVSDEAFDQIMLRRKASPGFLRLVFLSNMVRSKGVFTLLEAARILCDKSDNFVILFSGSWYDIEAKEFNKRVEEAGLSQAVRYLGFQETEAKYELLNNADIFVLPTLKDTFPLALLEAMQSGLPVVSTAEGAIPEIVDDGITGFIVPKNNAAALADKIAILMRSPQLRFQMGEAARKKFLGKYTFARFEKGLGEIFMKAYNVRD